MTTAQERALAILTAEYGRAVERGEEWVIKPSGIRTATVWALERAGKVEVKTEAGEASVLRRGSFGRWLGGTVRYSYVTVWVRPRGV